MAPKKINALRQAIPEWLKDGENALTAPFSCLLHDLWAELLSLDERLEVLDKEFKRIADTHPVAKQLM